MEPITPSSFEEKQADETPMVFTKKWTKTMHATLFCLSNSTIHMLLHNLMVVLVSFKGNLIMFINKEKNLFVYSIAKFTNKQHINVSWWLKYTRRFWNS